MVSVTWWCFWHSMHMIYFPSAVFFETGMELGKGEGRLALRGKVSRTSFITLAQSLAIGTWEVTGILMIMRLMILSISLILASKNDYRRGAGPWGTGGAPAVLLVLSGADMVVG